MSPDERITHLWPGEKNNPRNNIKNPRNNVVALEVAVRATEVLDLKVLKVKKCGIARRSVMIGGLRCVYCFIRFSSLDRTFLKQHFFPTAKRTLAIAVAITAPAIP